MNDFEWTAQRREAAALLRAGEQQSDVAEVVGVSARTLRRWQKIDEFAAAADGTTDADHRATSEPEPDTSPPSRRVYVDAPTITELPPGGRPNAGRYVSEIRWQLDTDDKLVTAIEDEIAIAEHYIEQQRADAKRMGREREEAEAAYHAIKDEALAAAPNEAKLRRQFGTVLQAKMIERWRKDTDAEPVRAAKGALIRHATLRQQMSACTARIMRARRYIESLRSEIAAITEVERPMSPAEQQRAMDEAAAAVDVSEHERTLSREAARSGELRHRIEDAERRFASLLAELNEYVTEHEERRQSAARALHEREYSRYVARKRKATEIDFDGIVEPRWTVPKDDVTNVDAVRQAEREYPREVRRPSPRQASFDGVSLSEATIGYLIRALAHANVEASMEQRVKTVEPTFSAREEKFRHLPG